MKKLMLALLVTAVLAVPTADAAYLGALQASAPYTLELTSGTKCTATILVVTRNGRIDFDSIVIAEPGAPPASYTIPARVDRMIFLVDATNTGVCAVRLTQGVKNFELTAASEVRFVFDVI